MTDTMKKFTKGETVLMVSSWDNKGTVVVQAFVVGSWGKLQAHLNHADGTLGRRIYTDQIHPLAMWIERASDVVDVRAWALAYGEAYIAYQREHFADRLAQTNVDAAYLKHMEGERAKLLDVPVILAELRAKGQVIVEGSR